MRHVICVALAACFCASTLADVESQDQVRTVEASVLVPQCGGAQDSDQDAAPGFGPYSGNAFAGAGCEMGSATAAATQDSSTGLFAFVANGTSYANIGSAEAGAIHAFSSSSYHISLEVVQPCRYVLSAALSAGSTVGAPIIFSGATVQLTQTDIADVFEFNVLSPVGGGVEQDTFHDAGIITPGIYDLRASANSAIDYEATTPFTGQSAYEMHLGLTRPGNVNGDWTVDVADLLQLLAAWGPCDPYCDEDVNADGVVDVQDLLWLLASWI